MRRAIAVVVVAALLPVSVRVDEPVAYRFSFPEPEHHWMQVEATFKQIGSAPLDLRMSRASPGRYALHDFAKNVYDVHVYGADGREIAASRPDPYGWRVDDHGGSVRLRYKLYGDRVDGTYLAIDPTHAHINMPATVMFGRGLEDRAATITFEPPPGRSVWRIATQLMPGGSPLEFTAPNLQYLMDSPAEFGPIAIEQLAIDGHTFRFAAHHTGTATELEGLVRDVEKIVREQRTIFGEYPAYEPGTYTFLADYLPYADGDGMEHRNSTVVTSSSSIASNRSGLLRTIAHEFFHNWNVERIRPRSLEPFDFERANMSAELWLAEGFTQYYGPLTLSRTGLEDVATTAATFGDLITSVTLNPGYRLRSAEEMSRMAAFTDGGRTIDQTNWSISYISYYPFGGAIALALDLTLRERFDGVSLDDLMRAMWREYGKPGGSRPGYVDRPYTLADVEARLAEVSGSPEFARDFFVRYIDGHEVADYSRLLEPAGFVVRRVRPGRAWIGTLTFEPGSGRLQVDSATAPDTPAYAAGIDRGDEITSLGGRAITSESQILAVLQAHRPGETLPIVVTDRSGAARSRTITLAEDPQIEVVPLEHTGRRLSAAQQAFRRRWLASHQ
jgi:predicted metalloprotease with PDZ domain